jgi:RNA polymerase sigma-70 factor (ECF subfamily)
VERIRSGDRDIFADLYDEYFIDLAAFAFRYVRDHAIAEDVVHDVFLKLWSFHSTIEIRTTLRAYLFSVVANRARDAAAQLRRDNAMFPTLLSEDFGPTGNMQASAESPYDSLESSDIRNAVVAAVATLPERQRMALTLRLANDMTYDEIATVLGITKSSVAELITKAQAKLKHLLRPLLP